MQYVVGSVPFVNAKPLVSQFEHLKEASPVKVLYQVPSKLPAMLDSGSAQAVLVSSFDALKNKGRTIAAGCSISTRGEAQSVRIFSKVPVEEIKTIALDNTSLTSIYLAQIILAENYRVKAEATSIGPNQNAMLKQRDACVLIGDNGMAADPEGLYVLDLGTEWGKLTKLPFVWAAWTGKKDMPEELAQHLINAKEWGQQHLKLVVDECQREARWPGDSCRKYLTEIMNYDLTNEHLQGLKMFQELLLKHGFLKEKHFPSLVNPQSPAAAVAV